MQGKSENTVRCGQEAICPAAWSCKRAAYEACPHSFPWGPFVERSGSFTSLKDCFRWCWENGFFPCIRHDICPVADVCGHEPTRPCPYLFPWGPTQPLSPFGREKEIFSSQADCLRWCEEHGVSIGGQDER